MSALIPEQLVLDLEIPNTVEISGTAERFTKGEAGLARAMPPGAERLLAALLKRGLDRASVVAAASLALLMDEENAAT